MEQIQINEQLAIPAGELSFSASRSGGPGGQNVNKVNTQVMLRFDVAHSPSLTDAQRQRILNRLSTRITREGVLVITSQRHRTQPANKAAAVEVFTQLLRQALHRRPVRKKTRVSRAAKERRIESKKQRSQVKRLRSRVSWNE
jgi:ribosome-associated protein